ncbi:transmembrane protein [Thalictrum thalictroides]|uniref:Transmembrane protein n=1 Tax=Thalictrum thalictroides TaxID=46969 RepID=A0A7J6VLR4_THATH|nr:transmembrane protein [Thalictrum thalictroides]
MEEIEDWEMVVHNSLETSLVDSSFREIDGGDESSQSLIKLDYFDLGSNSEPPPPSLNSEVKGSADLLMDCSTDGVNLGKVVDFEGKQELGIEENEIESKGCVDSEEIRDFGGNDEKSCDDSLKTDVGFEGISEIEGFDVDNGDDSGEALFESRIDDVSDMENLGGELVCANVAQTREDDDGIEERSESSAGDEVVGGGIGSELGSPEEGKRGIVWWKLPFELLKFCAFRVSPVLTISVAAALLGFVILRRRLSRMKRKSRSIPIKLTVEDKKVSQFTTRAARLNNAFSVVRRVPIMRPLLPAAGVTPWPAVNMR